jgi:hypothetical protein
MSSASASSASAFDPASDSMQNKIIINIVFF